MKKLLFIILLSWGFTTFATYISKDSCTKIARNFFYYKTGRDELAANVVSLYYNKPNGKKYIFGYAVNMTGGGWVCIQNQNTINPIFGYSSGTTFTTDGLTADNPLFAYLQKRGEYTDAASYLKESKTHQWDYLAGQPAPPLRAPLNAVAALVKTKWGQEPYVNELCPYNATQKLKAVTGCVATTMAQIMKYWNYPPNGTGSYSYNEGGYGVLSANFGATTYNWGSMPLTNSTSSDLATIMYHCGVAVAMDYGTIYEGGSGAYVVRTVSGSKIFPCAQNAFVNYFGYKDSMQGVLRKNFTAQAWTDLMLNEISNGRPIQYYGYDAGGGGHTWVLDGYDGAGFFHMNWGWRGSGDGFFSVANLAVAGYNFSINDGALIGIRPLSNPAPPIYCGVNTLSANNDNTGLVNFKWNGTGKSFEVQYKLSTSTTWSASFAASQTALTIGTLAVGSTYDWRVRALCNDSVSSWVQASHTLPIVCPTPTALPATNITSKSATATWTAAPGATYYDVFYKWSINGVTTTSHTYQTGLNYNISRLLPKSTYSYYLYAFCGTTKSAMSNVVTYTTKDTGTTPPPPPPPPVPTCANVTGLTATPTSTKCALSWAGAATDSFSFEFKASGAANWAVIKVLGTSTQLTGLTPQTAYSTQIKRLCGGISSDYLAGSFTTKVCVCD